MNKESYIGSIDIAADIISLKIENIIKPAVRLTLSLDSHRKKLL
jgi:hypothetical protein